MSHGSLIDLILSKGALSAKFQPVVELCGSAATNHYFEGLIRGPAGTSVAQPDILFEYARKKGREGDVDRACIEVVLAAARDLPPHSTVALNVHASTLARDAEFLTFLGDTADACGMDVSRLVIEVVEHAPPHDVAAFRNALSGLRDIGVRIALDDIGLGHSNFLMILECRPEYMKIDRYFVHGAKSDHYRQAVLASVAHLARPFGARVVAEGVEDEDDLATVRAAGIDLMQGWLFGVPRAAAQAGTGSDVSNA